jgi:hypothetical protein
MDKKPAKKRGPKRIADPQVSNSALENVARALERHSLALESHSRALSRATLQACVLKSLKLDETDLGKPFKKLWPFDQGDPIDHIDDACRPNGCYPLKRPKLHDTVRGKPMKNLSDFITIVGSIVGS